MTEARPASDLLTDQEVKTVLAKLAATYPDARTELNHRNEFELLIATILSAQATDAMVNRVTPELFRRCPTPDACLQLTVSELESLIKQIGLYRSKARNILATCRILVEEYDGKVPRTREELMRLPGVGRKTANVVLSNAFGEPAIAVDTHVLRVANRIGLAQGRQPDTVERQLMERIPRQAWLSAHHWLIWHGRRMCSARKPNCELCPIADICVTGRERGDATG